VNGRRVGEDKFYAIRIKETPGFGESQNFTFDSGTWRPEGVDLSLYSPSFMPTLARFYSIGEGTTNSGIDDTGFPVLVYDKFSDYVLKLNTFGTKFVKLARPGNPVANLGQFVGELHDLPRIPHLKAAVKSFRGLGNEYLNVAFGWKPFVNDLRKVYKLWKTLDTRLAQLVRDNGLLIRRRRQIERNHSVDTLCNLSIPFPFDSVFGVGGVSGVDVPTPADDNYSCFKVSFFRGFQNTGEGTVDGATGHFVLNRTTEENVRGRGNFRYFVEDIGSSEWTRRATNALYDVNVTPQVLWELYPWSWLTDWFSNVGDILSNLQANAVGREVLDSCYVIYTKQVTYNGELRLHWPSYVDSFNSIAIPEGSATLSWSRSETSKLRQPANPFGFGVDFGSLSAYQNSILAALAVSRQKRF